MGGRSKQNKGGELEERQKRARSQEVTMSPKENVNMDMSLLCPGGTAGQILYQSAHTTSLHEMWDELS